MELPFKRIFIDSEEYLKNQIIYIHQNPENFQNYKFSSYLAVVSGSEIHVQQNKIPDLFGDRENFIEAHKREINLNFVKDW
ncbi:hypothetical protein ODZ84_22105 [Chryseobacterium fluminis]|uniref:hypothetical protein n=1 Tax=Chryseobacterium fluminis TaxID=2983606 RepID=UPI002250FEC7|nr:hypothetical protein [Chryseobacterium sp. MMS21-Ot14]UZT97830.1 hypothetical protein ODZ84_22105 [Chryseobacterium sp. MMS21-Ot14]